LCAQLDVVGDSEENAVVSRLFSKFEKLTLTTYAERTSAIVIISGDDAAAAIVSKANHNGYKTVLVSQDPSRRQGPKWKSVSMHAAVRVRYGFCSRAAVGGHSRRAGPLSVVPAVE
jgi:hypothetical protein